MLSTSLPTRLARRVGALIAATLALMLALAASASLASAAPGPANVSAVGSSPMPGPAVAFFNRFNYGDNLTAADPTTYQFMDLGYGSSPQSQAAVRAQIARIHATDPNMKVLLYKAAEANPGDPTAIGACLPWNSSKPYGGIPTSWFVHDASGTPIYNSHYRFYWLDQSNIWVQAACLGSAVRMAKASGFDGIFFDNIAGSLFWAQIRPCAGGSPACQSSAGWQAAMKSFLSFEATGLHAAGLFAFANISGGATAIGGAGPAIWDAYQLTGIDGAMEESFTSGTNRLPVPTAQWKQELANEAWSEANGKYLLANGDVFSNEALNTYGLATVMLASQTHASWDTASGNYGGGDYIFPEYSTATALGAPDGPYLPLSNGVYERAFSNGIVLVNPTTNTVPPFWLAGGIYSGSGLSSVTSVSMAPNSALILQRVG